MRSSARSLGACMMSRYGTFTICKPIDLMKPKIRKSELPVAAAALSLPGCARASAISSSIVPTLSDVGTEIASTVT